MRFVEFLTQAKSWKTIPRLFLITGDETYFIDQTIATLRGLHPDFQGQCLRLNTSETTPQNLAQELTTVPMFSPQKLLVVTDDDQAFEDFRPVLQNFIDSPPGPVRLAWIAKNAKGWESWKQKQAVWIECAPLMEHEFTSWIIGQAQRHGKELDARTATEIAQRSGFHLSRCVQDVEKMCLFAGKRTTLTSEDVSLMVADEEDVEIQELIGALQKKSSGEALAALTRLMDQGENAQMLMGRLAWQYRRMLQTSGFRAELVEKHHRILNADLMLKTTGLPETAVLETLVCELSR